MRILLFFLVLFIATPIRAQENKDFERIINETVWKPFKAALENRDWRSYNELHTEDVLSISKWGVQSGDEFKNQIKEWYEIKDEIERTFDLWFEYRVYSEIIGCEVGFYRVINKSKAGEISESYGRFHVVLRKENGLWKIALDWGDENSENVSITKEVFERGEILRFD